jgi:hypothetical protein
MTNILKISLYDIRKAADAAQGLGIEDDSLAPVPKSR